MNSKYKINCPECKVIFDVSPQMNRWKEELFEEISELINKKLKNLKNKK